jgi:hypothetical protein
MGSCEQKEYKQMFAKLRPKNEAIFKAHGEAPPQNFRQVITRLQNCEANLIWGRKRRGDSYFILWIEEGRIVSGSVVQIKASTGYL